MQVKSIGQAIDYLIKNNLIDKSQTQTARKKLQYIKKGKKKSYKGIEFKF